MKRSSSACEVLGEMLVAGCVARVGRRRGGDHPLRVTDAGCAVRSRGDRRCGRFQDFNDIADGAFASSGNAVQDPRGQSHPAVVLLLRHASFAKGNHCILKDGRDIGERLARIDICHGRGGRYRGRRGGWRCGLGRQGDGDCRSAPGHPRGDREGAHREKRTAHRGSSRRPDHGRSLARAYSSAGTIAAATATALMTGCHLPPRLDVRRVHPEGSGRRGEHHRRRRCTASRTTGDEV